MTAFSSRLIHNLALVRTPVTTGAIDTYGQPVPAAPTTTTLLGFVAPGRSREAPEVNQAGALVADHVIFLPIGTDVIGADHLTYLGERYDVVGIRSYRFGIAPHHELDAKRVTSPAPAEVP